MIIEIRKATLKDLKAIQNLNTELFKYDYKHDKTLNLKWPQKNLSYYKQSIIGKNSFAAVAAIDGKIVGYFIGSIGPTEDYRKLKKIAEMDNMFVIKKYRGQGIGNDLVNAFLKWAKSKKAPRVRAVASAGNKGATNFYKNNKFEEYNLVLERKI